MCYNKNKMAAGDAKSDLLWVIGMVALLAVAWYFTGGPSRPAATGGPFINPPTGSDRMTTYGDLNSKNTETNLSSWRSGSDKNEDQFTKNAAKSTWRGSVILEKGNAASESNQNKEYIVIKNNSKTAVNISGWSLKNGDDEGLQLNDSGQYLNLKARWVIIPNAANIFIPGQSQVLTPINLAPGGRAVITSGHVPNTDPIVITASFRTNVCTGYLGRLPNYNFQPSLSTKCPAGRDEPGVDSLPDSCFNLVKSWSNCVTPKFERDKYGYELVNGKKNISSVCQNFIRNHFGYSSCLKNHIGDANFFGNEWRVFLNTGELWRNQRESITLYDGSGRLVDRITY